MHLILGLGNPGARYESTRHNMGFLALDALTEKHNIILDKHGCFCIYGEGKINGHEVVAAKPLTYMNESGKAAKTILAALDVTPEQVIVIHDDIDLPLGKTKKKHRGGSAGQRGVQSIIDRLQTDQFTRIRIGIGRPEDKKNIVDFVLSPFEEDEFPTVKGTLEQAVEMIENTLTEFNEKPKKLEEDTGC